LICLAITPAFAGTTNCAGTITGQYIVGNLTVPADAACRLEGVEVTGTVTVLGSLQTFGSRFDSNVNVTGGTIIISNGNGMGSPIMGNLTITNSTGVNQIGCPNISNVINGNVSFTGNSGKFYVCQATVNGRVLINNNTRINNDWQGNDVATLTNITTSQFLCDGNASADGSQPIVGGGNTAAKKNGQCSGL
jgi:hypothetical protein